MFRATIGTLVFSIVGFIIFIFLGVLISGSIWPELPYETALPYLLLVGIFGAVFSVIIFRKAWLKNKH